VVELLAAERAPRVGVGVDVDHPDRSIGRSQRTEHRVRDRVIAAGSERCRAGSHDSGDEGLDVGVHRGVVEDLVEPYVADVGDRTQFERVDLRGVVDRTHQR
jgi:hypothetical protein